MKGQKIEAQHPVETVVIGVAHALEVGNEDGQGAEITITEA
jgi:hypothetical protein